MSDEPTVAGGERREVLRRLAVGAAVVWVAPVVWSRPVGAQGTAPDPTRWSSASPRPSSWPHRGFVAGGPSPVHADLETTFLSITSVCFEFTFSAHDPLDCKESIRFYVPPRPAPGPQYDVGFANTGRKPQLSNGVVPRDQRARRHHRPLARRRRRLHPRAVRQPALDGHRHQRDRHGLRTGAPGLSRVSGLAGEAPAGLGWASRTLKLTRHSGSVLSSIDSRHV